MYEIEEIQKERRPVVMTVCSSFYRACERCCTPEALALLEDAKKHYTRIISVHPDLYEDCHKIVLPKAWQDLYREGIKAFNSCVRLHIFRSYSLENRAMLHAGLGDYKDAVEDLDCVIADNCRWPNPYYHRGIFKVELGDYREALEDFKTVQQIAPGYRKVNQRQAPVEAMLGHFKRWSKEEALKDV